MKIGEYVLAAIIHSSLYDLHETGSHPENKGRIHKIMRAFQNEGVFKELSLIEPDMADEDDLLRVHTASHLEKIRRFCESGGGYLDPDTWIAPQSYQAAQASAGAAIKAAELVLEDHDFAYSLGRPPGHHATRDRSMGFCLFNNLAISLEYLKKKYKMKKFMIFDFDVHHGNGTSEIYYKNPHVLYISIHQDPHTIFPGTGFIEDMGSGKGIGRTLNMPMPPGSTTSDYIYILERILEPVADQFSPDFFFFDVGFDAHKDDPLSHICLDDDFFVWIAGKMRRITRQQALILEGGYNLEALARCNLKMIEVLRGRETDKYLEAETNPEVKEIFRTIKDNFSPYFDF